VKRLIAVDWGTSSLRAALLDEQGQVLCSTKVEK
jgi:2-keto-3-deoxy-galactonokinase